MNGFTSTSKAQQARMTDIAVRAPLRALLALVAAAMALLALASFAAADKTIGSPGEGAGQTKSPQGLATDFETGDLYVADQGNNRIDVFKADGTFLRAFGWGVDTGASELQVCTTASKCQAGIAGAGAGQFSSPTWIAVDNDPASSSQHDVHVGTDNFHVQKFTPTGEFLLAFGKEGKGECELNRENDPIGVGPGGIVYVGDTGQVGTTQSFFSRLQRFSPTGACLGQKTLFEGTSNIRNLAVDSTGNSYVTVAGAAGVIRKYDPDGTLLYELDQGGQAEGLAVDPSDDLFAKQQGLQLTKPRLLQLITEYDSSGAHLKRFGYVLRGGLTIPGLATYEDAGHLHLYASVHESGASSVQDLSLPPPGPVVLPEPCEVNAGGLGNTKATLVAEVNPEGEPTTAHFQYVDQKSFESEGGFASPKTKTTAESESIGADFELHEASVKAEVAPETKYHCRAIATNADGSTIGQEGTFTSLQPLEIGPTSVTGVGTDAATVNATVNPLGIPTTGFFEYVSEATYLEDIANLGPEHGFDHAVKAPAGEAIEFGNGESPTLKSAQVSGLLPATSYRFRIRATDSFIEAEGKAPIEGPTKSFRTYGANAGALPDNRAWELVSPGLKDNAEVAVPGNAAGFIEPRYIRIQAGASSGEAVTYTSWTSFGKAESAPATSQYLSKRTPSGWTTENISPAGFLAVPIVPPYNGFSADLRFGAFKTTEPPLTSDCRESEDLYLRDNDTGELRCLDPEVNGGPESQCLVYAGASEDGSRVFLAGAPEGGEDFTYRLYEWSASGIAVVSVLPSETVAPATPSTSFGLSFSRGTGIGGGIENCQFTRTPVRNAISRDGQVAFWTYVPVSAAAPTQLFARVDGSQTVQLDALPAKKAGFGPPGNGIFRAASADGSVAYFTSTNRLISGSKANPGSGQEDPGEPDLYRYELGQEGPLTDLTKGSVPGDVEGVIGASDDGSYVYFVAKAALSGEEEGAAGEKAQAGKDNLYFYHQGEGLRFIAILASPSQSDRGDQGDWQSNPRELSARVSADGRHLAFLSIRAEALAGYENTIAAGEHCRYELAIESNAMLVDSPLCSQAFLYDAESKELTCASCNPSGVRPLGPSVVPGWSNGFEGPRYLSEDGSRLFFESFDALSLADENGKLDVYEFEQKGGGSCSAADPTFDPASGGCHFLISSGKGTDENFLVDASADGRDVFFSTREALTGWDVNENFDVYDARAGGGFAEPSQVPSCLGEACKAPATTPPSVSPPVTPYIEGPGNQVQKPPKKPRKPKKHKHAHKHKAKHKHARANYERRARR
jgi:hypothetical protein